MYYCVRSFRRLSDTRAGGAHLRAEIGGVKLEPAGALGAKVDAQTAAPAHDDAFGLSDVRSRPRTDVNAAALSELPTLTVAHGGTFGLSDIRPGPSPHVP